MSYELTVVSLIYSVKKKEKKNIFKVSYVFIYLFIFFGD